jgi:hypothetical protein
MPQKVDVAERRPARKQRGTLNRFLDQLAA